jgi:hypothetical protein
MRQKMVLNKMAHFRLAVDLQILLSATSYQAPIPPILDQSKTGFNRRDVGAVLTGSLMWSSSAFNRGRDLAVAASTGTKVANGYTSNGDTKFSLDVRSCSRSYVAFFVEGEIVSRETVKLLDASFYLGRTYCISGIKHKTSVCSYSIDVCFYFTVALCPR